MFTTLLMGKDNCIGKFTLLDTPQCFQTLQPKAQAPQHADYHCWPFVLGEKKKILSRVTKIIPPTSPPSVSSLFYEAWSVVLTLEHCDVRLSATTASSSWGTCIAFFTRIKDLARAPPMLIRVRGFFRNGRHMITFYGWGVLIIQWGFVSGYGVFIGNHLIFSTCHSKWTE